MESIAETLMSAVTWGFLGVKASGVAEGLWLLQVLEEKNQVLEEKNHLSWPWWERGGTGEDIPAPPWECWSLQKLNSSR